MTLHNLARLENTSIEFIVLKMDFVEVNKLITLGVSKDT